MDELEGRSPSPEPVEALLRHVPFFRNLDRVDIARLVGALEHVHLPANTLIFAENTEADALYLLDSGRVAVSVKTEVGEQSIAVLEAPTCFGELGLLLGRRTGSVRALSDVQAWKLPRQRFERLAREQAGIGLSVAGALAELLDQRSREHVGAPITLEPRLPPVMDLPRHIYGGGWRLAALAGSLGIPLALWGLPPPDGLSLQGWHVSLVLLGAAVAWLLEPVPDFVIALAMVTAWGLLGLAPLSLAFAAFTSSSYLVALAALGLAAAMTRSGLLFRIALFLLRTFPATYGAQVLALLVGGVCVTPLMPLAIARVATIAPLVQELSQNLGFPARSRGSAGLSFAGMLGYGAFSSIFMTGLAMNFFVLELLPASDRAKVDWLKWVIYAAPAGLVILLGTVLLLLVLFRPERGIRESGERLQMQGRILGPLSKIEIAVIVGLTVLLAGLLLRPLLGFDDAWIALSALVLIMVGGGLDREGFRGSIEWGFLVLFGVLLGTGGVLRAAGVDQWIGRALIPLARIVAHPGLLIVVLAAGVVACRLVLPWIPATLLLSLTLVPQATRLGLPPWVVGFVILLSANTWLHPRQSDFYRLTWETTRGEMFSHRDGFVVGVTLTVVTLVAIGVSVPYWRAMGLLTP